MKNETHKCNAQLEVTNSPEVVAALELIARYYHQKNGIFANEAFDHINYVFFGGNLPRPLIQIALTAYGGCLGLSHIGIKPIITLHPAIFEENKSGKGPWGISPEFLGPSYAYEVLLHECIHIQVEYILRPQGIAGNWKSSHDNPIWISEVKRIAPMIGLSDNVSMSKSLRVPIPGEKTKTGKPKTKVARGVEPGCLSFQSVARFPHAMREELGKIDFYKDKTPPWQISRYPVTDYYVLQINSLAEIDL